VAKDHRGREVAGQGGSRDDHATEPISVQPQRDGKVITGRTEGSGVASGVLDAREIACAWPGITWTMLQLII
jgi:hypothetical protein